MSDYLYTRASTNETKQDLKAQLQLAVKYRSEEHTSELQSQR